MRTIAFFIILIAFSNTSLGQSKENGALAIDMGPSAFAKLIDVVIDTVDHSIVKRIQFDGSARNAFIQIGKTIQGEHLDRGAISFNAFVEQWTPNDSAGVKLFVEGIAAADRSVVSQLISIKDLLCGRDSGRIQIVLPYEQKLERLRILISPTGSNKLVIRDLSLTTGLGECGSNWEKAVASKLSNKDSLIDKLTVLCKIWGLLKYFEPGASSPAINWDLVLIDKLNRLLGASPEIDFNRVVTGLIEDARKADKSYNNFQLKKHVTGVVDSVNIDFSWINKSSILSPSVKQELKSVLADFTPFKNKFVTTPAEDETLPSAVFHENGYNKNFLPSVRFRLLALFRYWNIIQYYYPYKNFIKNEFDHLLENLIPVFITASSSKKYGQALITLNAALHDGHAPFPTSSVNLSSYLFKGRTIIYPFTMHLDQKGRAIISRIDPDFERKSNIHVGQQVLKINNHPISTIIDTLCWGLGETRKDFRRHLINNSHLLSFLPQPGDTCSVVTIWNNTFTKLSFQFGYGDVQKYRRFITNEVMKVRPPYADNDSTRFVSEGILYINPNSFKFDDTTVVKAGLAKAKTAIIDCRLYPSRQFMQMAPRWFLADATPYVRYEYCDLYPGLLRSITINSHHTGHFYYSGNVVVLISNATISRAELLTMLIQARKDKTLTVGSRTVGADGDVTTIPMIGYQAMRFGFSGLKVLYPNGVDTHGVGIAPDYYIPDSILLHRVVEDLKGHHFEFPAVTKDK